MKFNCTEESIKNALENGEQFNEAVKDISLGKCESQNSYYNCSLLSSTTEHNNNVDNAL